MTITDIRNAIEKLREVDATIIAADYERECIENAGLWTCVRLTPQSGEWYCDSEVSKCCSTDEYFGESGVFSAMTLISSQSSFTPGPGDGYEWEEDENGSYWGDPSNGDYCCEDDLETFLEKEYAAAYEAADEGANLEVLAKSVGLYKFSVTSTPVNPDYTETAKMIQEEIDARIKSMEEEIERLEAEESIEKAQVD